MLDGYIIDRIHRDKAERVRRDSQVPLHIEPPRPPREAEPQEPNHRGSAVIDFQV